MTTYAIFILLFGLQTGDQIVTGDPPKFMGHVSLRDSYLHFDPEVRRWIYSFEGDWKEVSGRVERHFKSNGYKRANFEDLQENAKLSESWRKTYEWWRDNSIKLRRGPFLQITIVLLEDSVTVIRDTKLTSAKQLSDLGPNRKPDPGWVTVILAKPTRKWR